MKNYLNTLLSEKGISQERIIEVEGPEWGTNFIPLKIVVDFLDSAPVQIQKKAKNTLIKIDFKNGDVMHFFTYIAGWMAK